MKNKDIRVFSQYSIHNNTVITAFEHEDLRSYVELSVGNGMLWEGFLDLKEAKQIRDFLTMVIEKIEEDAEVKESIS